MLAAAHAARKLSTIGLTSGLKLSKDLLAMFKLDVSGMQFGRLTAIRFHGVTRSKRMWECKCACGAEVIVSIGSLRSGNTKSCGCLHVETARNKNLSHGRCRTKIYSIWTHMLQRCRNPNRPRYHDYGGRGITVCKRWLTFENFFEDMGEVPAGHTLDRIDNDGNYEPKNCKWSTPTEQTKNSRARRPRCGGAKRRAIARDFWAS